MIRLVITTLEKTLLDQEVESVQVPGESGELGILPGHAALITSLKKGEVYGKGFRVSVLGGLCEVQPNRVLILASSQEGDSHA